MGGGGTQNKKPLGGHQENLGLNHSSMCLRGGAIVSLGLSVFTCKMRGLKLISFEIFCVTLVTHKISCSTCVTIIGYQEGTALSSATRPA